MLAALLALLALLGCCVAPRAAEAPVRALPCECREDQFRCADGKCARLDDKCDGVAHCDDASDESPGLCSAPNTTLAVGDVLSVRVQMESFFKGVDIQLCGRVRCNTLEVEGANVEGNLAYIAFVNCNLQGRHCKVYRVRGPNNWAKFPAGEVVLAVEHRASELAAWLPDHPEQAVAVPVREAQTLLRVVPFKWRSDMRVRFVRE